MNNSCDAADCCGRKREYYDEDPHIHQRILFLFSLHQEHYKSPVQHTFYTSPHLVTPKKILVGRRAALDRFVDLKNGSQRFESIDNDWICLSKYQSIGFGSLEITAPASLKRITKHRGDDGDLSRIKIFTPEMLPMLLRLRWVNYIIISQSGQKSGSDSPNWPNEEPRRQFE